MEKFSGFHQQDANYKTVDGVAMGLTVLVPRTASPGVHPVILRWHGGFLFMGTRMFADWFPSWILQFAMQHSAILVTPDYRLLPESAGMDILADVADLFSWLPRALPSLLSTHNIQPDLRHLLVTGESAGGWLAVQSALLHNSATNIIIRAVISAYGVLDVKVPFFTRAYKKTILGAPMFPADELDKHKSKITSGSVPRTLSASMDPTRRAVMLGSIQQGRYAEVLGRETALYPMENLERVQKFVPMWLFHGREDSAVPVEGSISFHDKVKRLHPSANILLTLEEGEHGLDATVNTDTPWLKHGLAWTTRHWLGDARGSSL